MKKRILLLVESPFTERDYVRFGVIALGKHFDVQVIDFSPWLRPAIWKRFSDQVYYFDLYRPVKSYSDFQKILSGAEYFLAFDYLSKSMAADRIRREIKVHGTALVATVSGLLPQLPQRSLFQKISSLKYRTNWMRVLQTTTKSILLQKMSRVLPDIAIMTGTDSLLAPGVRDARKIWTHSSDYDVYLGLAKGGPKSSKQYAVYTDEDCAFHSDFEYDNFKPLVTAEKFYPSLMRYFREFEHKTGIEVVIAAHPRSRWDLRPHLLEGRDAVKGRTAELISNASLVFSHASTSIGFAVIFGVPLAFLTSDEMDDSLYREEVRIRSSMLRAPLINIDRAGAVSVDDAASARVDEHAYTRYRERYIKKAGTPDLPTWDIFVSEMLGGADS